MGGGDGDVDMMMGAAEDPDFLPPQEAKKKIGMPVLE